MASIFTYDPDPPRVASPWLQNINAPDAEEDRGVSADGRNSTVKGVERSGQNVKRKNQRIMRLQAEPQEGPVEYKLHLLLRSRRKFITASTAASISGSQHSAYSTIQPNRSVSESPFEPIVSADLRPTPGASTPQTRQHRLEQLTTQLLWRLQQSSPHHTSSATNIILPSLPEALPELHAPTEPAKLLHGLEESQGALYEIGVSDDGTLVGLAEDEMKESLNNLRAMAACLGCTVEILREEHVGQCEWWEEEVLAGKERPIKKSGALMVVEALVKPCLQIKSPAMLTTDFSADRNVVLPRERTGIAAAQTTEQLRITLTGPTMSGKSTLLGTLTTSTLDNGKGKSRLSMLKHRHEITTGVTSSVTQELLGYHDTADGSVEVINYATENVASWIDIHVAVGGNRLVFVSDSAGHPRYRRTTVRGLVGWLPHYTVLCVPADDTEDTAGKTGSTLASQQAFGPAVTDMDLSSAQLELCLKLDTPLVVVVTKLDLASRNGLRSTLTKILDALKAAGRKPAILPHATNVTADDLQNISSSVIESAYHAALPLLNDVRAVVPIVLTSAIQGTGISNFHALLHELPIPTTPVQATNGPQVIFHIEDIYSKPADTEGVIVSGRLRVGRITVGDCGALGPFSVHEVDDSEDSDERSFGRKSHSHQPTSRSFPGALRHARVVSPLAHLPNQEWRRYRVVSVRNLRLPVHALEVDEVGTIAIVPEDQKKPDSLAAFARIRKGMILADIQPQAARTFVAEFKRDDLDSLAVGNHVVVYIASVRASARVISARIPDPPVLSNDDSPSIDQEHHEPFEFDTDANAGAARSDRDLGMKVAGTVTSASLLVTLHFDNAKEFVMVGDQVLVMPGGGPGLYGGHERGEKGIAGLEGFVGKVVDTFG